MSGRQPPIPFTALLTGVAKFPQGPSFPPPKGGLPFLFWGTSKASAGTLLALQLLVLETLQPPSLAQLQLGLSSSPGLSGVGAVLGSPLSPLWAGRSWAAEAFSLQICPAGLLASWKLPGVAPLATRGQRGLSAPVQQAGEAAERRVSTAPVTGLQGGAKDPSAISNDGKDAVGGRKQGGC